MSNNTLTSLLNVHKKMLQEMEKEIQKLKEENQKLKEKNEKYEIEFKEIQDSSVILKQKHTIQELMKKIEILSKVTKK